MRERERERESTSATLYYFFKRDSERVLIHNFIMLFFNDCDISLEHLASVIQEPEQLPNALR